MESILNSRSNKKMLRKIFHLSLLSIMALVLVASAFADTSTEVTLGDSGPAVSFDVSTPLRDIPPAPLDELKREVPKYPVPKLITSTGGRDEFLQTRLGSELAPPLVLNFEGVGLGFTGPSGTYKVNYAPSDSNSDIGPSNVVEIVNSAFAIFDKAGNVLLGPISTKTIWSGFGGACESNNDGDAVVKYDKLADRWIITQFSISTKPYLQCIAVSRTGDPTGAYARYSFKFRNIPDYPKLGVWPDAYYIAFNMFNEQSSFVGAQTCAYDRQSMLNGSTARQQCFQFGPSVASLLPSDLDGKTRPPLGSPNYHINLGSNNLWLWKFHVDWVKRKNSSLIGPTKISVAQFAPACSGGVCVPQLGTGQQLDSLGDRLMYRLAYRNFTDHESLVVNHSVAVGETVGIRWYEIRSPNVGTYVYQQGTFAPDTNYRWMGSIAMDGLGNIGMGYSVSSSSMHPAIRYTGHATTDGLGVMGQGEGSIIEGGGSQTGGLDRWGDYTSLSIDPVDDCTFWYTNQYLATNGRFNWHTRIGSFKMPGCP
ncbi:MAG: hypothetical protein ACXVCE_05175 [Bacteriovorax sp.]